jgi:hypothetical protein
MALNWKVNSLTASTEGSLSNVVSHVEWECTFITESVCRRSYGRVKLQTSHLNDEGQSFTEFEDLSEDTVIDWVKSSLGSFSVTEIEKVQEGGEEITYSDLRDASTLPSSW